MIETILQCKGVAERRLPTWFGRSINRTGKRSKHDTNVAVSSVCHKVEANSMPWLRGVISALQT